MIIRSLLGKPHQKMGTCLEDFSQIRQPSSPTLQMCFQSTYPVLTYPRQRPIEAFKYVCRYSNYQLLKQILLLTLEADIWWLHSYLAHTMEPWMGLLELGWSVFHPKAEGLP